MAIQGRLLLIVFKLFKKKMGGTLNKIIYALDIIWRVLILIKLCWSPFCLLYKSTTKYYNLIEVHDRLRRFVVTQQIKVHLKSSAPFGRIDWNSVSKQSDISYKSTCMCHLTDTMIKVNWNFNLRKFYTTNKNVL